MTKFFCVLARIAALAAVAFGFAASVSLAAMSPTEKRVALVIGNGAYQSAVRLDNAVFDARAVADAFRKLGFEVVDGYDLDIDQMRAKVSEFSAALSDSKSAVIYYAGHGVSVDEENYLIPTDIVLERPDRPRSERDQRLVAAQANEARGPRQHRHPRRLPRQSLRRGAGEAKDAIARGRARIEPHRRRSGARDVNRLRQRSEEHGPRRTDRSAQSVHGNPFLDHLFDFGVTIDTVMSRVRNDVWEKTGHHQLPWVNTSLIGEYELNPQPGAGIDRGKREADSRSQRNPRRPRGSRRKTYCGNPRSIQTWRAIIKAYLSAFPNGVFAQMAKNQDREHGERENLHASGGAANPRHDGTRHSGPTADEFKGNVGTGSTRKGR